MLGQKFLVASLRLELIHLPVADVFLHPQLFHVLHTEFLLLQLPHMEEIIGFWKRKDKALIITTILDKCNSYKLDYKS